jgi:proteasome lid subunit RPN8/RPN11
MATTPGKKSRLVTEPERVNPVLPVHLWRSQSHGRDEVQIVAHLEVYAAMHAHAMAALPNETGGFLLGRVAWDIRSRCWLVEIDEVMLIQPLSQGPVHFSFTYKDVDLVRTHREHTGKALLGWFHTHPDVEIFLSETDLEKTHRILFSEPFQVALVYDPVRGRAGYFCWDGPQSIDASPGAWREFEIQEEPEPEPAPVPESALVEAPPGVAHAAEPAAVGDTSAAKGGSSRELVAMFQRAAAAGTAAVSAEASAAALGATQALRLSMDRVPGPGHPRGRMTIRRLPACPRCGWR